MANIKSAKKRILQSNKRRVRNKSVRSETRTEIKKFLSMVGSEKDTELQIAQLKSVQKTVDTAAGKGVIHKNKAARINSRLAKRINAIEKGTINNIESPSVSEETQVEV